MITTPAPVPSSSAPTDNVRRFVLRGGNAEAFQATDADLLVCGPAGTGKTRTNLEWAHYTAATHPGVRGLFVRKTFASLKATALITFDEKVQPQLDGVVFKGDTAKRPPHYQYPNGSTIVIGGLDRPSKIMSSDYDFVLVFEATELEPEDWDALSTRLRNGVLPFQQLRADCNPSAPTHWLKQRVDTGAIRMIESRHEDNPSVTPAYLSRLDALPPLLYLRFRVGLWAAAEGMVYQDAWNRRVNLVDRFPIPAEWPRLLAIDFGYSNPFVCQWWAFDGDGRMYLYREIYHTRKLTADMAELIKRESRWGEPGGDPLPAPHLGIIADHDAQERAQLEASLGVRVQPAYKAVKDGIQIMQARLRPAGDGQPRMFFLRDSLCHPADPALAEVHKPTCTIEEFEGYIWPPAVDGKPVAEEPIKRNDHGLDAARYACATIDHDEHGSVEYVPSFW